MLRANRQVEQADIDFNINVVTDANVFKPAQRIGEAVGGIHRLCFIDRPLQQKTIFALASLGDDVALAAQPHKILRKLGRGIFGGIGPVKTRDFRMIPDTDEDKEGFLAIAVRPVKTGQEKLIERRFGDDASRTWKIFALIPHTADEGRELRTVRHNAIELRSIQGFCNHFVSPGAQRLLRRHIGRHQHDIGVVAHGAAYTKNDGPRIIQWRRVKKYRVVIFLAEPLYRCVFDAFMCNHMAARLKF